ncbi:unnamed protein product [Paramecium primaurelia]|uniref:Transmembrane protein n=1 Tax=Paramecium primaurelia TaxID=5886 RepID=A0A8S1NZI8_PARPR|nr:unnamed protein product [Paramecium primaurelia]
MTDNDNQVIQFEEDDQEQEDNLQQKSGKEQNNEQLNNYDQNYNQGQQPDSNDFKPLESEKQPIQVVPEAEEGFLNRIKGCSCRRQTDEKTDENNEGCIAKLDRFIQKYFTPTYLLLVYYSVFSTALLFSLKLIIQDQDLYHAEILGGLFLFVQLLKGLLIYFLNDEWLDELPYLDSSFENGWRQFKITFFIITNLDICYWIYYIYVQNKKDSTIEHMMTLCRMLDALLFNFPLMIVFFYLQMQDLENIQIPYLVIAGLNLISIVNGFMHLNFFAGSSFLSIRWSIQFICELYVKLLLVVSVYIKLQEFNIQYEYFGLFCLCGLIQFYLFSDEQDFTGQILSIIYFQFKTFFVIIFKEESFGMSDLDCDAQPGILNVVVQKSTYSYIQKAFNFCQIMSLAFIFWLFGGWDIVITSQILLHMYLVGLGCLGIIMLNLLYILLSGWKKNMLKP